MHSADFFRTTSPRLILEDYIEANADVAARETLLQLAPFALQAKIGKEKIAGLFSINPRTARIHRPWFIWNTLRLAGLERHWYAYEMNHDTLSWKGWLRRIERHSTEEEREKWRCLLYVRSFPDPGVNFQTRLWTKGGSWWKKLPMARILVMHEHIERPDCWYKRIIGDHNLRLIENELMAVCDPDRDIMPTQYFRAVRYVRNRVADFAGRPMRMEQIPWFFQMDVSNPDETNRWYLLEGGRAKNEYVSIEW